MDCAGDVEPARSAGGTYSSRRDVLPDALAGAGAARGAGGEPPGTAHGAGGLPGAYTVATRGAEGVAGDRSAGGM